MRWQFFALAPIAFALVSFDNAKPKSIDISHYESWHVVNKTPVKMSAVVSMLCVGPSAKQLVSMDAGNPHHQYFLRVYVSKEGNRFEKGAGPISVGTIIVKEKLNAENAKEPVLYTVMRKREKGFDADHGDWEYAVANDKRKIIEQGKIERCISCHETQKSSDYLYRSYVWSK